MLVRLYIIHY